MDHVTEIRIVEVMAVSTHEVPARTVPGRDMSASKRLPVNQYLLSYESGTHLRVVHLKVRWIWKARERCGVQISKPEQNLRRYVRL